MNWKRFIHELQVRAVVLVATVTACTGCISYRSTGGTVTPEPKVQLTGSNIPVRANSANEAAASGAPVMVFNRSDMDQSGTSDLAGFLHRVPFVSLSR